jgi:ABC-type transport system involved in multi-copper enzyme maturation permease subunit
MKTIIRKELRENFKLAVIGFAILTLLLVQAYRSCCDFFIQLAFGQGFWQNNNSHPLLSDQILSETALFCAIFGTLLGWVQIHNERHRDLWAFLIHRPISRSEIFFGKVIAGLCLYTAGAALPLLGYIIIAWMPGHFPVPFTWQMVLPLMARFLCGTVFYFGGLLTGIRQARWYASRGLGLGAGIILILISTRAPEFWRVLIFLVPGVLIVGMAAWGSFISGGYYEGQTVSGRRMLVASLMLGCFVVIGFVTTLLASLVSSSDFGTWTNYQMGKNGAIYKSTQTPGKPMTITDLDGKILIDKKTGRPMLQNDFYKILAPESSIYADFETNTAPTRYYSNEGFNGSAEYFSLWRQTVDTLWYWCPNGRLWGYDLMSRRFIGSLGPDGFTPGVSTGQDRFGRMEGSYGYGYYYEGYPARTLMTDTAIYQLDYDNRTSKLFFTTTNNQRIGGAVDVSMDNGSWDYSIVVTKDFVRVLTPDGKLACQVPYKPEYPSYDQIGVHFLQPTNNFAFWFDPSYETNELSNWTLPSHIVWTAGDQGVVKSLDLPSTDRSWREPFRDRLSNLVMPPVSDFLAPFSYSGDLSSLAYIVKEPDLWVSVAGGIISAGVGWGLGRRYYFNAKAQLRWAVFNLCFGLPGLLAFICAQEWPTREACSNCKKPRMVDREQCEHCGEPFAPPAKNGTEIFEGVTVGGR